MRLSMQRQGFDCSSRRDREIHGSFWRFATLKVTSPVKSGAVDLASDGGFVFAAPKTAGEVTFGYELSRDGLTTSGATVTISVVKKPKKPDI